MKTDTEINARIAVLDREIAAATCWGAALTARNEERAGLLRELALCEIAKPVEVGDTVCVKGKVVGIARSGAVMIDAGHSANSPVSMTSIFHVQTSAKAKAYDALKAATKEAFNPGKPLASGGVVDSASWTGAADNIKKSESWPTKPRPTLARALLTLREWLDNGDFPRCSEDVKITIDIPEAKQTADVLYRIMQEIGPWNGNFFVLNKSHRYVGANLMFRHVPPAPKPLAVGDMTNSGKLIAIDGEFAWCSQNGKNVTCFLADLKRADGEKGACDVRDTIHHEQRPGGCLA